MAQDVTGDRRRCLEFLPRVSWSSLVVDEDDHPNAYGAGVAEQRSAVDPSTAAVALAVLVWFGQPSYLGGDTTTLGECLDKFVAYARRSAYP